MNETNEKMYLSKYIEENIDIHQLGKKTCIVSGVGSGKNYWVEKELINEGNILFITSRKAKKDEAVLGSIFECKLKVDQEQKYVAYTYAGLENLIKNSIVSGTYDSLTSYFKYIVVDEVHFVITDSTFTDAPFHLWTFIKEISEIMNVILMTGTISPIRDILLKENWNIIDCMDKCKNVKPSKIIIENKKEILKHIKRINKTGQKMIYMANSAENIRGKLYKEVQKESNVPKENIAFSMANDKSKAMKVEMQFEYEQLEKTYKSIIENNKLPSDVNLLLATSRLKEGINIKDENIKTIFCESHIATDIIQFAGRVRDGVEVLYIVNDVMQNIIEKDDLDYQFCKGKGLKASNDYLAEIESSFEDIIQDAFDVLLSKTKTNPKIAEFVKYIESKFRYIRFNHLKNRFELYELRYIAEQLATENLNQYVNSPKQYIENIFGIESSKVEDNAEKQKILKTIGDNALRELLPTILYNAYKSEKKLFDKEKDDFLAGISKALGIDKPKDLLEEINEGIKNNRLPYKVIKDREYKKGQYRNKRYIKVIENDL